MKITVLGSGTSGGVPSLGCDCKVCRSWDRRDRRMRASVLVASESAGKQFNALIDVGPDFRFQGLREKICGVDAAFLTHAHADHIHGIDDLRPFCMGKEMPLYGNQPTLDEFRERFAYLFRQTQEGGGKPHIKPIAVLDGEKIEAGGLIWTAIPVKHGELDILGWLVEDASTAKSFLYLTDVSFIGENALQLIKEKKKIDVLLIDGLRKAPHGTHFSFAEALEAALVIGAEKTFLTHICHTHSHREIGRYCKNFAKRCGIKNNAAPAWDGLRFNL